MLEQNEKALQKFQPEFYRVYKYKKKDIEDEFQKVELVEARDGKSALVVTRDGQEIRLNSTFKPEREAEKWAAQYQFEYMQNVVVMFGLGNGMFARAMLKRLGKQDSLILHEPSRQIFDMVLEQEDVSDILGDSRVQLSVDSVINGEFYFNLERSLDWRNVNSLQGCSSNSYVKLFRDKYNAWIEELRQCMYIIDINKSTSSHFAKARARFIIRSMAQLEGSSLLSQCRGGIPKDFPAIIVAAGPSLDKNIDLLKKAEKRAFILATDSAVKTLLKHDIAFDAMLTIDVLKNPKHISDPKCQNIPLFCDFASRYQILQFHQGKKIWVRPAEYAVDIYEKLGHPIEPINCGGCVANAALAICNAMEFKTIILVGQDLAYMGEVTHAGGIKKKILNEDSGLREVEGIDGGMVKSRYDWLIYLDWFEGAIEQLPDVKVIDATEGGALIHGSKVMTLSDAIEQCCKQEFSMREYLEQLPPTFNEEEYAVVLDIVRKMGQEMRNIKREAQDAEILCDKVLNEIEQFGDSPKAYKVSKRLSAINERIISKYSYGLLDCFVTEMAVEQLKDINHTAADEAEGLADTYQSAKAMYRAMLEAIDILIDGPVTKLYEELDGLL